MTINQIITKYQETHPGENTDVLVEAYEFALAGHRNQKRKTGEPYIEHTMHTAFVLAQIKADRNTVIAGLLHDILEDTDVSLSQIEKKFGKEVMGLVEGVTKLEKNINYSGTERYAESLRKMFLAMAKDIRVILIKFSDRLHNLRTLEVQPEEKRRRVAKETLEIYVPIAGLLGIWRLKWQMEDNCFKYLYPEEYKKLEYKYEVEKKMERNQYIQKVKKTLEKKLYESGIKNFSLESRFKHLYSIWKKMQKKDRRFDEIYDVFALRIITESVEDCYRTIGVIHSIWKPLTKRFKDYISAPKPNGYRSLHTTVCGPEGKATEFQIRTKEMNDEAQYGIAAHWYYKQDKKQLISQPNWIKEILKLQRNSRSTDEFINQLKFDLFQDRIFVLTPKGDVIDLPEGATPVDFAYAVHTDIGDKCAGVLVNNKMSTLDQPLHDNDQVEIIVEKKRKGPNPDWIKFVKTNRAKDKIKHATKSSKLEGIKNLIPGLKY